MVSVMLVALGRSEN